MTTRALFEQLCTIATALEQTCAPLQPSHHKRELEQIVADLDHLIDAVLDDAAAERTAQDR
jgi:hypothetical protein